MSRCAFGYTTVVLLLAISGHPVVTNAGESGATVTGRVQIDGKVPVPKEWTLDETVQRATGEKVYREETWLVSENNRLAHCVITLKPKNPAIASGSKPLKNAVLDKVGVRYVPRVLVVTPGTEVLLRNRESPCLGFQITGKPSLGHTFAYMIPKGTEQRITLRGPDTCSVSCDVRPYTRGHILVVDTPYFAVTDADGSFTIRGLPADAYQVAVWHEGVGKLPKAAGPAEVVVADKGETALVFRLKPQGIAGE